MATKFGQLTTHEAHKLGYLPAKTLLDGKEIKNVVVVNDIEGWVDVYKTDEQGNIAVFGPLDDPRTETYRIYGDVTYIPNGR